MPLIACMVLLRVFVFLACGGHALRQDGLSREVCLQLMLQATWNHNRLSVMLQVGVLAGVGGRFLNARVISAVWFGADILCICIQGGEPVCSCCPRPGGALVGRQSVVNAA